MTRTGNGARLEVPTAGEEWEPLTAAAALLGKKWHAVVLHRLIEHGPLGFNDLARRIDGLSNKVLSECLDDLEAEGLVTRRVVSERPFRVEYALTDVGTTLEPVLDAMVEWGENAVERVEAPEDAVVHVPR